MAYDVICNTYGLRHIFTHPDRVTESYIEYSIATNSGGNRLWSDSEEANSIMRDLEEDCDAECWKKGSRWSIVYLLNALVIFFLMISMIFICLGTKYPRFRVISSYLATLICLFHSVVLILTAVFRFRP